MVMPYLNGKTLEAAIAEKKRFSITETLALMMPVMDITDRLHQKGILHLNIHPGNIFLVDSGEVILMDSGRYSRSFVDAPMETIGENSRYQAPEIRNLHEKIDGSVDVYSICTIMYEMITGTEIEDRRIPHNKRYGKVTPFKKSKSNSQSGYHFDEWTCSSQQRPNKLCRKIDEVFCLHTASAKSRRTSGCAEEKSTRKKKDRRGKTYEESRIFFWQRRYATYHSPMLSLFYVLLVRRFLSHFGHFKGKNTAN